MFNILTLSLWFLFHPVHVTMTSIDHVPGTDSLKVFCRMYFDDFLHDYQTYDDDRDLTKIFGNQPTLPADLVNNYFNSKVFIYVNNKLLIGKLLTVNLVDNEISMNLHYRTVKKPKRITVRNMMLAGWFSDQVNMIIVRTDKFEKGIKLTPEYNEETFIIK
jgi:hypothetical protein